MSCTYVVHTIPSDFVLASESHELTSYMARAKESVAKGNLDQQLSFQQVTFQPQ